MSNDIILQFFKTPYIKDKITGFWKFLLRYLLIAEDLLCDFNPEERHREIKLQTFNFTAKEIIKLHKDFENSSGEFSASEIDPSDAYCENSKIDTIKYVFSILDSVEK